MQTLDLKLIHYHRISWVMVSLNFDLLQLLFVGVRQA